MCENRQWAVSGVDDVAIAGDLKGSAVQVQPSDSEWVLNRTAIKC